MGEIKQKIATLLARKSSHNDNDQYIQRCTPNCKKIPFFDGDMCKLDFIDWLLDLEEYFNFWKICDEEKVRLASNKLDNEAEEWWEDIQIDRKRRLLAKNEEGQNQNYHSQVHVLNKGKGLRVEKKQPITKEKFEVVKKGQDFQQVDELKLEKKIELIVEDHRNQEIVIIENIVEDPLEVKEPNQVIKAFEVFVYLERKISDFKGELEDEFVSSGGV
uniref:Uncharacterized protein n=1 Tax=Quercus lobata TaxID=97700 RepID=A0A7N2MLY1_QUELO